MTQNNGNGHGAKPAIPFTAKPEIPIVGQPFTLKAWFLTIQVVCNCGQHEPVLIIGQAGAAGVCPACKKVYVFQGIRPQAGTGNIEFMMGVGVAQQEPEPAPVV